MSYNPADELVDVIDDQGRTVGTATRRQMRAERLPHRSVYVLVFNKRSEIFIHLRTATKDIYPAHWDMTAGGVLTAGESFDEGARREVMEELGVLVNPEPLFPFRYADEHSSVRAMVYRAVHEGPFRLQVEEIVRGEFVSEGELGLRLRTETFCPDGVAVWRTLNNQSA